MLLGHNVVYSVESQRRFGATCRFYLQVARTAFRTTFFMLVGARGSVVG
jgi:hypothetical protein